VTGCARCEELRHDRAAAEESGDHSKVTDCNVLLRRHDEHTEQRPDGSPKTVVSDRAIA
jgi:hypothetical protein